MVNDIIGQMTLKFSVPQNLIETYHRQAMRYDLNVVKEFGSKRQPSVHIFRGPRFFLLIQGMKKRHDVNNMDMTSCRKSRAHNGHFIFFALSATNVSTS